MRQIVAASLLVALAKTVNAAPLAASAAAPATPIVSADWAEAAATPAAPVRDQIREAVGEELAESKTPAAPTFYRTPPPPDKYEVFQHRFEQAKVPGCLRPDGLKRQPTFGLGGVLGLPFIALAALRGKCN